MPGSTNTADKADYGQGTGAGKRAFEVSAIGAVAVIALTSIAFAGAAWLISDSRFSLDAFDAGSALRRMVAGIAIALRSPAPVLMLALVMERLLPVTPAQRDLTRGFYQDIAWYAVDHLRVLSWIPLQIMLLISLKRYMMGNRELIPDGVMPAPLLWVVGILAGDFLAYWSHRLRHRFDILWNFHAIHHSQQELNVFTQNRFHDVDIVIDLTIRTLPLLILNAGWMVIGIYAAVSLAHFRLYHSNIRTNYGVLRYILVTPQSHRIHHTSDPRYLNRNFGVFFSIWDRAFGTQHDNHDEYPQELGIRDDRFPIEQGTLLRDFPRIFAAQMLYPFRQMLRLDG
jgi:sterol desaturase/sphingolipid hydroxylase (fatty acid hydroxylase superfamily)